MIGRSSRRSGSSWRARSTPAVSREYVELNNFFVPWHILNTKSRRRGVTREEPITRRRFPRSLLVPIAALPRFTTGFAPSAVSTAASSPSRRRLPNRADFRKERVPFSGVAALFRFLSLRSVACGAGSRCRGAADHYVKPNRTTYVKDRCRRHGR